MTEPRYADSATVERHAELLAGQPYPLAFVTLSGSHLYGFSSPDSDWDLRGVHVVPAREVLGLDDHQETVEDKTFVPGSATEVLDELVTHDARKYFRLLLRNNGYVLEQIFSPLVVLDNGRLERIRAVAARCITSQHSLHYKGFGYGEWSKFVQAPKKTTKRILYVFRVLLSGIHMMRTGRVEANIVRLNEDFELPYIETLIAEKREGTENAELPGGRGLDFYTREYERLMAMLIDAATKSHLPKQPDAGARHDLNELLVEMRLGGNA